MLWNRCCVVVLSVVCHGRAIPLLWRTLEHPSASVSSSVSIALLEKADRLLAAFGAITLLADRAFPSEELLGWFDGKPRWSDVMRLRSDTWIHGTAAPMGCEVRAGCACPVGTAVGSGTFSSGPMVPKRPTCYWPTPAASPSTNPGTWSATQIPRWIWSGAMPSASAVSSCSATRNQASSSWRAVV
jgi:hypothetical protein